MPVSVVIGGQFGSEGKGKVALEIVRREQISWPPPSASVARTPVTRRSGLVARLTCCDSFRLLRSMAGSESFCLLARTLISDVLGRELNLLDRGPESVAISPMARIITDEHRRVGTRLRAWAGNRFDAVRHGGCGNCHDSARRGRLPGFGAG